MFFRVFGPESGQDKEVYASKITDAAAMLAKQIYGNGWNTIKVYESADRKSAIVLASGRRPFRVDAIS